MEECLYFTPNVETDPVFAFALQNAAAQGVQVKCISCKVTEDSLAADGFVPVRMNG
jgi:DNA-binding sugar fermentation-stimulating protein